MSSPVRALLMRMDSNLCLCSPAEMKCHLNQLHTEMSNAVSSYFLSFKYPTTFRNQEPALIVDLQPQFLIASQAPTDAFKFVSHKTFPGEYKGSSILVRFTGMANGIYNIFNLLDSISGRKKILLGRTLLEIIRIEKENYSLQKQEKGIRKRTER